MGIAVVKVSREMLAESLPILSGLGALVSVQYPAFYGDPCEVRIATGAVPDGEHLMRATMTRSVDELTATLSCRLEVAG